MVLMGSIAVVSYIKNKKESAAQGESAAEDTTHFLGQRNLGNFVMYFNVMASFTSGVCVRVLHRRHAHARGLAGYPR